MVTILELILIMGVWLFLISGSGYFLAEFFDSLAKKGLQLSIPYIFLAVMLWAAASLWLIKMIHLINLK